MEPLGKTRSRLIPHWSGSIWALRSYRLFINFASDLSQELRNISWASVSSTLGLTEGHYWATLACLRTGYRGLAY